MILELTESQKTKLQEIVGAPIEEVFLADDRSRVVIFTKYIPKERTEKEQKLSEFLGTRVLIKSYSYHIFWYLKYENNQFIATSQFGLERTSNRRAVKMADNIKTIKINELLATMPQEAVIAGKVINKVGSEYIVVVDETEAVKLYPSKNRPFIFETLNVGDYVIFKVQYTFGQFNVYSLKMLDRKIDDIARVDFHIRTKYSPTIAIVDIDELVQEAKIRGHKTVGVCDLNSVQGFPVLESASKANGLQPIYSAEILVYEPDKKIIEGLKDDFRLASQIYVVFDFETTGTSPKYDEIIEIGAVKLVNGQIVDNFYSLVKPRTEISKISQQITGITMAELENAPSINHVWPQFLDFIKDSVLVAHNADFDVSFIKAISPDLDITYLDTLRLSRTVQPNRKIHSLASLVRQFRLGKFKHHRADEDAAILAKVFLKLLEKVYKQQVFTAQELNKLGEQGSVDRKTHSVTVVVRNQNGLKNLYKIISEASTKYLYHDTPAMPIDEIFNCKDGLLFGAGLEGSILYDMIHNNSPHEEIMKLLAKLDFLEIAPIDTAIEKENASKIYPVIVNLAKKTNKPLIATSFAHYLYKADAIAFKALANSKKAGLNHREHIIAPFLTTKELIEKIKAFTDDQTAYQAVVVNPNVILSKLSNIVIVKGKLTPPGIPDSDAMLKTLVSEGLTREYGHKPHQEILERVNKELDSIINHGFAELYMLAKMVVDYSNKNGYIVGSRGSVGSSLVAYLIGITEVNPLPAHYVCPKCYHTEFVDAPTGYDAPDKECPHCKVKMEKRGVNIPFETFCGFEGEKVPDIDLNFSDEFQEKAHEFVRKTFGEDKVFRAGTVLTVAEKNAYAIARDYAHKVGKLSEEYITYIAKRIEGTKMGTSQHPGGLLIIPSNMSVHDFTPYHYPANDTSEALTTHIAYEHIHDDVVKLDALGHLNPTILKYLREFTGIDPLMVPLDDEETLKLFNSTEYKNNLTTVDTIGIPEFGTPFVRRILDETKPTTFDELVRIAGLSHGTNVWNGNAQTLIQTGIATLKNVIAARDDIMLYLIEKGMDKRLAFEIMERVRKGKKLTQENIQAMKDVGIPDWYIESCNKIEYLFPKAHAAAYTIMSFRIAWYKRYYPVSFYAAILSKKNTVTHEFFMMSKEELLTKIFEYMRSDNQSERKDVAALEIIYDAKVHGIEFVLPNIFESRAEMFVPLADNKILLPFNAINGIGTSIAYNIEQERNKRQFSSIEDFKSRTKINKNQFQVLSSIGALGTLEHETHTLFA